MASSPPNPPPPDNNDGNEEDSYNDAAIVKTARDALETKFAAVQAGYYVDPYLETMIFNNTGHHPFSSSHPQHPHHPHPHQQFRRRRFVNPIIKRGTYARVCCMDRAIGAFLHHATTTTTSSLSTTKNATDTTTTTTQKKLDVVVVQIVVLGAGLDTSYFRWLHPPKQNQNTKTETNHHDDRIRQLLLAAKNNNLHVQWYEVDHGGLVREKVQLLQQQQSHSAFDHLVVVPRDIHQTLTARLRHDYNGECYWVTPNEDQSSASGSSSSSSLFLLAHDLRKGGLMEQLRQSTLSQHHSDGSQQQHHHPPPAFDPDAPTLFLSECVQMYLPRTTARDVWRDIAQTCTNAVVVGYEPILGDVTTRSTPTTTSHNHNNHNHNHNHNHNSFGTVMEANLKRAGLAAPSSSLVQLRTLEQHAQHLAEAGFSRSVGCDLWVAYQGHGGGGGGVLTPADRRHAHRCELLDEWEEFALLMQHYGLWACATPASVVGRALCRTTTMPASTTPKINPMLPPSSRQSTVVVNHQEEWQSSIGFPEGASAVRDPDHDDEGPATTN
eukprot:CAMPEP_0168811372 /NCGR_PEP_ID=MMETSP0726-20121227/4090_1 /TAXON_ID=265536 /ORGANISM="Amphiprora sp., Strain CCMP467" /LENGTH=551 /DNA_ID=CAMNT_0008863431 /DNA_START=54 /DNA_END=1709 /DNA_ORIENTATION=-